jgi:hypothetical protein
MLKDSIVEMPWVHKYVKDYMPFCLQIPRAKKHVSLILYKNRVLAVGTNNFKGHPIASSLGYRFAEQHSELNALLKCEKRRNLTLVNLRFNAQKEMRMSRPCAKCLPWCCAIFDEIYYTCPDGVVRMLDKAPIINSDMPMPAFIRNL